MVSSRRLPLDYNESTYGAMGDDYSSLNVWESATDIDLVAAQKGEIVRCEAGSHTDFVQAVSALTSSDYFRVILPKSGHEHEGDPSQGVRFDTSDATFGFDIIEPNFSVQDIVVTYNRNVGSSCVGILSRGVSSSIVGCITIDCFNPSSAAHGIGLLALNARAINSVAIRAKTFGMYSFGNTVEFLNCTTVGCVTAGFEVIDSPNTQVTHMNCLGALNSTDFRIHNVAHVLNPAYNASRDTTAPGTNPQHRRTFRFQDAANDVYLLSANDGFAKGKGTDLSAHVGFSFDDDIAGLTRTLPWSIGASGLNTPRPFTRAVRGRGFSRSYTTPA